MGVRFKSVAIILMSVCLLMIGEYIFSDIFLMDNVRLQEKISVEMESRHAQYLIDQYLSYLATNNRDWAAWDDTLNFINTMDKNYITSNLSPNNMDNLKVDAVVFYDKNQRIKYAIGYNPDSKSMGKISDSLKLFLEKNNRKICSHPGLKSVVSGIVKLKEGAMLISSAPITDSQFKAPMSGTLLFGRYLDADIMNSLDKITNSQVEIFDINQIITPNHSIGFTEATLADISKSKGVYVYPVDPNKVEGYSLLRDIYNQPLFFLKVSMNRNIYNQGRQSLIFFTFVTLASGAILTLVCIILLQRNIVNPLLKLSNRIKNLDLNNFFFDKLIIEGKDEISNVAKEINKMLFKIAKVNEEVTANKKQLELVLQGANLGFWDLSIPTQTLYISRKSEQIIGNTPKDIYTDLSEFVHLVHENDIDLVRKEFYKLMDTKCELENLEFRILNNLGEYRWVALRGNIVENDEHNNPIRLAGIITDIDEKKRVEKELNYLSYFDKLTGLNNRGYFEYLLNKKILHEDYPFAIVIGDINGLKITNDTFGHTVGDNMITAVAIVLQNTCREDDIISRWGGDEFAIVLNQADDKVADEICSLIKENCLRETIGPIALSIALGYSVIKVGSQNIQDVIREAEERMYRNKLFESQSARSSIISSLRNSLAEKSHETEEHTSRIHAQCLKVGKRLKMSNAKIDELVLLAFLHDIGKIAIPDTILNKPAKLNDEEWAVMKTHTEIGYRIASATPELSHIAYAILAHHERFDGLGYPKGLKDKEIPIISKIISVIDSFDVMTHDRSYKKAMTIKEGIAELQRCSGTQFDPEIVEIFIDVLTEKEI